MTIEVCKTHKVKKLGMLEWYADVERRVKNKQKQTQCPKCKLWFWPDEL
jgi:hypothetical protein